MCLTVADPEFPTNRKLFRTKSEMQNRMKNPDMTKRAMTVYKVLSGRRDDKVCLESPYMGQQYEIGWTYEVENFTFKKRQCYIHPATYLEVEKGIHAYRTYESAKISHFCRYIDRFIVKCIIPKGTPYFKGLNGDIVALRMTFKEIIK